MSRRPFRLFVTASVVSVLISGSSFATSTHPNHHRGYSQHGAGGGQLDSINLQNGNLTLAVPIGQPYPLSARAGYSFSLIYNSNVWDIEQRLDTSGEFPQTYHRRLPARHTNAGLGWSLTLGNLTAPGHSDNELNRWIYLAPDGSQHTFYETLHHGEPSVGGVLYTRDGTYLRLKTASRTIEFPDGTVQTFNHASSCAPAAPHCRYELTQIQDGFLAEGTGAAVNVSYSANQWTITDTHSRTHYVNLSGGRIVDVRLQTFGGTQAIWNFAYHLTSFEMLKDPGSHDDPDWGCTSNGSTCAPLTVEALMSVELPDKYHANDHPSRFWMGSLSGSTWTPNYATTGEASGRLTRLRLPTLGYLDWEYGTYLFPYVPGSQSLTKSIGVTRRRTLGLNGVVEGTWTYDQWRESTADGSRFTTTAVTDPAGIRSEHYFCSYAPNASGSAACEQWEHALPYRKNGFNDLGGMMAYISTTVTEGGNLRQRVFLAFERDAAPPANPGDPALQTNVNRRVSGSRVRYDEMAGVMVDQFKLADFDGLGHYRNRLVWSSIDGKPARTYLTVWNPLRGTYPNAGVGSTFSQIPTAATWHLGTYTSQTILEGASTIRSEYCFNAKGQLTQERRMATATRQTSDLQRVIDYVGANPTRERLWGGDRGSAASTAECGTPAIGAQYRVDHTWQYGVLKSSSPIGVSFKTLDLDIDRWTGLPSGSRDAAGFNTSFTYDKMGRIIQANPWGATGPLDDEAFTSVVYRTANWTVAPATGAVVNVRRQVIDGDAFVPGGTDGAVDPEILDLVGTDVAQYWHSVDGLGRLNEERYKLPGHDLWEGQRKLEYESRGLLRRVSQWGQPQGHWSTLTYDWKRRPVSVLQPDGGWATFTYSGPRERSRTTSVWSGAANTNSTTTELFDRYGNLVEILEPSVGATLVSTSYNYDIANRLTQVSTTSGATQNRSFTWDGRGLMTGETHPELGGWQLYAYDSAGALATRDISGRRLCFVYDGAGRTLRITDGYNLQRNCVGTTLKEMLYDGGGSGAWSKGKLTQASRFATYTNVGGDPGFNPTTEVREQYVYDGRGGRPSSRSTSLFINGSISDTFTQSFQWTKLGDLHQQVYPQSVGTPLVPRVIGYGHDWGYLQRVFDINPATQVETTLATLSYASNQTISQIAHGNGVVETIGIDPQRLPRPASLTAKRAGVDIWRSGTYSYDLSGNVKSIGSSSFGYDRVSRLTSARVATADLGDTGGTPPLRQYQFDAFGNLTSLPTQNVPVQAATNRVNGLGASYDVEGNMTGWGVSLGAGQQCGVVKANCHFYEWDALGMMQRRIQYGNNPASPHDDTEHLYVYTADDERLLDYKVFPQLLTTLRYNRWTLRGIDGRVVRELVHEGDSPMRVERDYVYRGGALVAGWDSNNNRVHFTNDHLGTPRLITNVNGFKLSSHAYDPFGLELTSPTQSTMRLKFTGHERDFWNTQSAQDDDLDYMHARHYNPLMGRFPSVDPIGGNRFAPQSWNRYSYVLGNPMKYIDPWGATAEKANQTTFYDWVDVSASGSAGGVTVRTGGYGGSGAVPWFPTGGVGSGGGGAWSGRSSPNALPPHLWGSSFSSAVSSLAGSESGGANLSLISEVGALRSSLALDFVEYGITAVAVGGLGAVLAAEMGAGTMLIQGIDDILANPTLIRGWGPRDVQGMLLRVPRGWRVESLGRGSHQGQGWVLRQWGAREPTGQMIRWHPGGGHHGANPYWRVVSNSYKSPPFPAGPW